MLQCGGSGESFHTIGTQTSNTFHCCGTVSPSAVPGPTHSQLCWDGTRELVALAAMPSRGGGAAARAGGVGAGGAGAIAVAVHNHGGADSDADAAGASSQSAAGAGSGASFGASAVAEHPHALAPHAHHPVMHHLTEAPPPAKVAAPAPPVAPVAPPKTSCQRASEAALRATYALVLSLIAVVSWLLSTRGDDREIIAWCIAAFFVALSVPLVLHDIHMHLQHFVSPLQRFYIRILFFVPIYAIESWLSLRYQHQSIYIATLRDLYEPFVIHAFYQLLLGFLGSRDALARKLVRKHGAYANITLFPWGLEPLRRFSCAPPDRGGRLWCFFWRNGATFIFRTQIGIYQYVLLKVVLTIGFFAASLKGTLGDADDYAHFNAYYSWILLFSQVWAITCLVLLFEATLEWLRPLKPFFKFVSVKGIVFLTWMQAELIQYLHEHGYVYAYKDLSAEQVAEGLQNFVICIEMLGLAYLHHVSFGVQDFWEPGKVARTVVEDDDEPKVLAGAVDGGTGHAGGAGHAGGTGRADGDAHAGSAAGGGNAAYSNKVAPAPAPAPSKEG